MTGQWVVCDDCAGRRTRGGVKCAGCDGEGRIFSTAGRDALKHALCPVCGPTLAGYVLDCLDENRDMLAGWLAETGMLVPTGWGLVRHESLDGWGHRQPPEMLAVRIEGGPNPSRLYRLVVQ